MIPPMTNPMGKHWDQPKVEDLIFDPSGVVMMLESIFKQLAEYSSSCPTDAYEGKMWKSQHKGNWFLRWYDKHPNDETLLLIRKMEIVII